jgi:hypothetical protein
MLDLRPLATILLSLGALLILQEGWTLGATPNAVRPAKKFCDHRGGSPQKAPK